MMGLRELANVEFMVSTMIRLVALVSVIIMDIMLVEWLLGMLLLPL